MNQALPSGNEAYYTHSLTDISQSTFRMDQAFHLYMVLEGDCQVQSNAMTRHVKTNDIFFFPGNTPYTLYSTADSAILYQLQIFPSFFREFCPELMALGYDIFHIPCNTYDHVFQHLCHILSGLVFSALSSKDAATLRQFSFVSQLLLFLSEHFGTAAPQTAASNDYIQVRINEAMNYIAENYADKISLESISHELGLHPQYFSAFFKKQFHMNFTDYLNLYRVNQSLFSLQNTNSSILEIAVACGFRSHKTYCSAFKKYFGILPSAYRRQPAGQASDYTGPAKNASILSRFHYLRNYWMQPKAEDEMIRQKPLLIEMDLSRAHTIFTDNRLRILSIGSGFFLTQKAVCEQLQKTAAECHFTHIHFRDVFSDLLKIYTDPGTGEPFYYWNILDQIIQTIHKLNMYPFIEIGYMPRDLASSRAELGFGYHPNVSPPKSEKQWRRLIKAFLQHYADIYGMDILRCWRFDFWNSANIHLNNSYWQASQKQFFDFYRLTYNAFMEIDKSLQLGSPNFSLPDGMDWYEAFFDDCITHHIKPAFLSLHMYSCLDNTENARGVFPYPATTCNYLSLTNTEYPRNLLRFLNDMLHRHHMDDLPLITTEWNITFHLQDLIRDTAFMAPYIIHTHLLTMELTQGLTYTGLSDISDLMLPSQLIFSGGYGLIDSNSVPKPAYNAFVMLHKLDQDILACDPPYIITRSERGYHILIYNLADYDNDLKNSNLDFMSDIYRYQVFAPTDTLAFHGIFTVDRGTYTVRTYAIDREHGSAFDAWQQMGSPETITDEIRHYLQVSAEPQFRCHTYKNTATLTLEGEVPPHGALLLEIEKVCGC